MRTVRALFLIILAVVLVTLAFANRQMVSVSTKITADLPGFTVNLPLFLVILFSILIGIILGLVWEWLREAETRSELAQRSHEVERLRREVSGLRQDHRDPEDEVLAILDAPKATTKPTTSMITR